VFVRSATDGARRKSVFSVGKSFIQHYFVGLIVAAANSAVEAGAG